MEPTSFNVGDHVSTARRRPPDRQGFNGADVFQRRRPSGPNDGALSNLVASMEPTSFNVGDPRYPGTEDTLVLIASMEPTSFNVGDSRWIVPRHASE